MQWQARFLRVGCIGIERTFNTVTGVMLERRCLLMLVVEGLELQSFSYHPALFLVAGPVFFLCLLCFFQSELRSGERYCRTQSM
eukprot:1152461-Pelagomonas_calceolata.AAC.1